MEQMNVVQLALALAGILGWAVLLRTLWAAREGIVWVLKATAFGAIAFVFALMILPKFLTRERVAIGSYGVAGLSVALVPKRSRYIPAGERRKAIAKHEARTGERYSPKRHHVDHIWPHARGGSNTADNLRVVSKRENLRKGAQKPRLRDWL